MQPSILTKAYAFFYFYFYYFYNEVKGVSAA